MKEADGPQDVLISEGPQLKSTKAAEDPQRDGPA